VSLASDTLILADGVLVTTSLALSVKFGLADLLGLGLVDSFDQHVLVLVRVTLSTEVQAVVHVLVNFLLVTVLAKQTAENASSAHPQDVTGHASVGSTSAFTSAVVAALSLGLMDRKTARAGVHGGLATHDQAILVELSNVLAYCQ